jgi:hypothetical protein
MAAAQDGKPAPSGQAQTDGGPIVAKLLDIRTATQTGRDRNRPERGQMHYVPSTTPSFLSTLRLDFWRHTPMRRRSRRLQPFNSTLTSEQQEPVPGLPNLAGQYRNRLWRGTVRSIRQSVINERVGAGAARARSSAASRSQFNAGLGCQSAGGRANFGFPGPARIPAGRGDRLPAKREPSGQFSLVGSQDSKASAWRGGKNWSIERADSIPNCAQPGTLGPPSNISLRVGNYPAASMTGRARA